MNTLLQWSPFLPAGFAVALAAGAVLVLAVAKWRRVPDLKWRALLFVVLAFVILNPIILHEVREGLPDKLVVVVDESPSQAIGGRDKVAEKALAHILESLEGTGVEPVVIRAAGRAGAGQGESTALFSALRDALPGIPLPQVAGTVFITDGQVHDVPPDLGILERAGPFHAVLTGRKDETDRKITVVSAPRYGLLSENADITVKVEEIGGGDGPVTLDVMQDGRLLRQESVTPGEERVFSFTLGHSGQNVFEFAVPPREGELTQANNTAAVIVNGVRDRLRVLLVSGSPHMGERAWRNLLKSDPSIDLVHFTILRSTRSVDATPQNELALIAFPVDELFRKRLDDFDLIIFDRYQQFDLLMPLYFQNIASFIKRGGAFLLAMGSDEAAEAIFRTSLAEVLPVAPAPGGEGVVHEPFTPALTALGARHPVTGDLHRASDPRKWGPWFSQADIRAQRGQTLMTGTGGLPLLVIDHVTDGRVAVLASDDVWLWSKGGGPYAALLRNVAHWLMKEPELEEDYIRAEARGNTITIAQRDLSEGPRAVMMTDPAGKTREITLDTRADGWVSAEVEAEENGVYSFASGARKTFVVVGTARNAEFSDVHTTADILAPPVERMGGGIVWFANDSSFSLRQADASARWFGGQGWIALRRNGAYAVKDVESRTFLPNPLALLALLAAALFAWWRESGSK